MHSHLYLIIPISELILHLFWLTLSSDFFFFFTYSNISLHALVIFIFSSGHYIWNIIFFRNNLRLEWRRFLPKIFFLLCSWATVPDINFQLWITPFCSALWNWRGPLQTVLLLPACMILGIVSRGFPSWWVLFFGMKGADHMVDLIACISIIPGTPLVHLHFLHLAGWRPVANVFTTGSLYISMAAMPSLMKSESQLWSVSKKSRAIEEERGGWGIIWNR